MRINGAIDGQGRCKHWHSPVDVVANKCATCEEFSACSRCHAELTDHEFGPMPVDAPAVLCGACGVVMDYYTYSTAPQCPRCGHMFNPGCSAHAGIYFAL